jgi:hypothetical protein
LPGLCRKSEKERFTGIYSYKYNWEGPRVSYDSTNILNTHELQKIKINLPRLTTLLSRSGTNSYEWYLDYWAFEDWDIFREYLFWARENGIKTTIKVRSQNNPVQSPYSAPFKSNWARLGNELGKMAQRFPEILAVVLDDYSNMKNTDNAKDLSTQLRNYNPYVSLLSVTYYDHGNYNNIENWKGIKDGVFDGIHFAPSEKDSYDKINPYAINTVLTTFHKEMKGLYNKMNALTGGLRKYPNLNLVYMGAYFAPHFNNQEGKYKNKDSGPDDVKRDFPHHEEIYLNLFDEYHRSIEALKNGQNSIFGNSYKNFHIYGMKIANLNYYTSNPPNGLINREYLCPWWRDFWIDLSTKLNPLISNRYPNLNVGDPWRNPWQNPWQNYLLSYNTLETESSNSNNPFMLEYRDLLNYLFPY